MDSFSSLLSVEEARSLILSRFFPLGKIRVDLFGAHGSFLAETITSPIDLPYFDNSSMDGFAVIAGDISEASEKKPITLRLVGDIPAGVLPENGICSGEAMRIMTGAMMPQGADAVVPLEFTGLYNQPDDAIVYEEISVFSPVEKGAFLRKSGEDITRNAVVLESGKLMRPQEIGLLAMLGFTEMLVYRSPKVGLLSTGDELITHSGRLAPGKIYDSNSITLGALIHKYGGDVLHLGIARDDEQSITRLFDFAIENRVDLIISSAGVSVGAFDCVRSVVEKNGNLTFWKVNMRPGKPLAFGSYGGIPFIGLPGNPVSAFVCFEIFVRPALLKMKGSEQIREIRIKSALLEPVQSDGRESYLRASVFKDGDRFFARLVEHQGSGNLYSLVKANAFLILPSGVKSLPVGAEVDTWILDSYF
jgi:molybdopterin molybdotransferase